MRGLANSGRFLVRWGVVGCVTAVSVAGCGAETPIDSAPLPTTSLSLTADAVAANAVSTAREADPPPLFKANLLASSFGARKDDDTIDVEVESFLDRPAEILFLVRALDETQRVVVQLSGGLIDAGQRRTATLRVGDLGLAHNPLAVSGVLSLYPVLITEAGARTPPPHRALRVYYHPAGERLLTYDAGTRASTYRGGALTDEVFRAAGATSEEVLPGYRGARNARPEHDGDGEPDPEHNLAEGVSP